MKRHFMILLNPVSGSINKHKILQQVSRRFKAEGITYESFFTEGRHHASDLVKKQLGEGFSDLLVVGGDGTLNETVNGIEHPKIPLSIIPTGTGNDFVRAIKIERKLQKQIDGAIYGKVQSIDLGLCNERKFINCMGFGFDGKVVEEMEREGKKFGGHLAYLYTILKIIATFPEPLVQFEIDGKHYEQKVFLMAINNGSHYGGGLPITPKAQLNDGLLDICLMDAMPLAKRLISLPKLQLGKHEGLDAIQLLQAKKITIHTQPEVVAHVDGEFIGRPPFEVAVLPNSLKIRTTLT